MAERRAPPLPSLSRSVGIVLRTAHLGAMALLVGGAWFGVPAVELRPALVASGLSGAALLVSEASHSRHWVYQLRGVFVLVHMGLLALAPRLGTGALLAALVVGAVGSHLSKPVRAWSLRHGAVVD